MFVRDLHDSVCLCVHVWSRRCCCCLCVVRHFVCSSVCCMVLPFMCFVCVRVCLCVCCRMRCLVVSHLFHMLVGWCDSLCMFVGVFGWLVVWVRVLTPWRVQSFVSVFV